MSRIGSRRVGATVRLTAYARRQEILETDASEHFGTDAIGDAVHDLRAVLRRVDVRAERALPERRRNELDRWIVTRELR